MRPLVLFLPLLVGMLIGITGAGEASGREQPALAPDQGPQPAETETDETSLAASPEGVGRVQIPRTADDDAIERRLVGIFGNVEGLKDIQVKVNSGVVTLQGESPSERLSEKAELLAQKTDGVVFVENRIRATREVAAQVKPTLGRLKERLDDWGRKLPLLLIALGVFVLFGLLARLVRTAETPYRWIESPLLRDIVQRLIGTVVWITGALVVLELLDITALVGAVFGAAGAAGIILGFAFRDIIENYLASILLSVRRPFSTNDHVVINAREGKVVRLTSRDTILMTLEGNHLRLPNAAVFKAEILNYTRNPLRQFNFAVGLGVKEDISSAIELGRSTLRKTPGVTAEPPPFARVEELGESNVALRFFAWVDQRTADWFKVRSEAIRRTKVALEMAGVDLPVPIYQVNLCQTEAAPPRALPSAGAVEDDAHEVSVDDFIERQIAEDHQREGDGENLLVQED